MWQDAYFTMSGLFYSLVLIPSMLDPKTEVSRKSSVPTAFILGVSALVWMTMGMHASAAMSAFAVLPWAFLAWRRPIRSVVGERDGEITVDMAITEREHAYLMRYREFQELQRKVYKSHMCIFPSQGDYSKAEAQFGDPSL